MSLKILLVERDLVTADALVPGLERKGYLVAVARSQGQALVRLAAARPDLLIVDVASFGVKGYKVADAVRSKLDGVPAILLLEKGHASAGSMAEAFMTQPFTSRGLLHRVKKLAESVKCRELRAGPLVLDPDSRNLHRGEASCYLRPKEAALLELFMRNPGRVLGRDDIMRTVWETDPLGDTRTLSVHIRWLREKIEQDPNRPRFLRTVRGVGYRFEVPADTAAGSPAQTDERAEPS